MMRDTPKPSLARPVRVLILEDNASDAGMMVNALKQAGIDPQWVRVSTEHDFIVQLDKSPELILADYALPQFDGLRALQLVRARAQPIPFILVSGRIGEDVAVEAMRMGADDYLLKDRMTRLGPAVLQALEKHALRAKTARAEMRRYESEERLRLFVEHAPAAIAMLDNDMRYIAVSRRWCSDYRLDNQNLIERGHYEVFPDMPERWKEIHRRCLAGAVEKCDEDAFPRSDGRIDWVRWEIHPWRKDDGKIGGVILFSELITERKLSQAALLESEQRFRAIFDHAGIGITMRSAHDRGSPWIQVNDHFCKLLGYTRNELLKLSTADITPADQKASAVSDNESLLRGDITSYSREKQITRKDGQRIWVVLTVASLPGSDGQPANLIATYQDITRRKEADFSIRRLNRVYAVLSGINSLIARVHDLDQLLSDACRIAVEQGQFELAWIGNYDPGTKRITPVAWAGENSEKLVNATSSASNDHPLGTGISGGAIMKNAPVFVNDLAAAPDIGSKRRREAIRLGYRSSIGLPLVTDGKVASILTLYVREPNFFDDQEVALLAELASNISISMESIARQHKIEKLSRIRSVSGEINSAIVRIRDRETLLRETCRITLEHGEFDLAWIGMVDQQQEEIRTVAWSGFPPEMAKHLKWSDFGTGRRTLGEAMRTRQTYVRQKINEDPPAGALRQFAIDQGYSSSACLPLEVDEQVVAIILLFAREEAFFDSDELALLREVAADVSFALQTIAGQERLDYLSYYDPLTGLPNRALFMDRAGQQMRSRGGEPLMVALMLINIERFRYINETYSRSGGDDLLRLIARRLESTFYGKDYLARIGADGFGIVIRGIQDSTRILRVIEDQILTCFREPFMINGEELRVAAKIGVAVFPVDGSDADTLFRNAEAALKRARESGERYLFYAAEMNARAAQSLTLESRLRRAVETQEFVLHYQPKYALADGKICGMEALIRWQDPASGLVAPGTFIPLLEETGLILEVGKWALDNALAQHREWTALGLSVPRIAVNVSAIQLQQKNFADVVIDAVQKQGDNADALELEVTESLLMKNVQDSIRTLSVLRGLGITIAMDDFGTGYSSLAYIARLPITSLKIDRSFITGMTDSSQNMNIVATIIALAHSMNLKVVAEGVETEEQSRLLKTLACDEVQGFLFCKPLPARQIEAILRAGHSQ